MFPSYNEKLAGGPGSAPFSLWHCYPDAALHGRQVCLCAVHWEGQIPADAKTKRGHVAACVGLSLMLDGHLGTPVSETCCLAQLSLLQHQEGNTCSPEGSGSSYPWGRPASGASIGHRLSQVHRVQVLRGRLCKELWKVQCWL